MWEVPTSTGVASSASSSPVRIRYTERQGQDLAFIHAYTKVNGRSPAQADLQRFFTVTAPSAHQMLPGLERRGLLLALRDGPAVSKCSSPQRAFRSCNNRPVPIGQNYCAEVLETYTKVEEAGVLHGSRAQRRSHRQFRTE